MTQVVDSKGLHETLATEKSSRDRFVAADAHLHRENYLNGAMDKIVWVTGNEYRADHLLSQFAE